MSINISPHFTVHPSTRPAESLTASSHTPQHLMIFSVAPITTVFIYFGRQETFFYDRTRWWKIKLYTEINRIFHLFIHPWTVFLSFHTQKKILSHLIEVFSLPSLARYHHHQHPLKSFFQLILIHWDGFYYQPATAFDFARITKLLCEWKVHSH